MPIFVEHFGARSRNIISNGAWLRVEEGQVGEDERSIEGIERMCSRPLSII